MKYFFCLLLFLNALNLIAQSDSTKKADPIFDFVEEEPEFPGGMEKLYLFIKTNLRYPSDAKDEGIQGKVYVQFVIDEHGKVSDAKILRGISTSLDEEALRLVRMMPVWKPGKQRGIPVNTKYNLPINFKLD